MTTSINVTGLGSMTNAIYRQSRQQEPEEGMGCTILMWTDRYAATIVLVSADKKRIWVERDKAIRLDDNGRCEQQIYRYERSETRDSECYSLRKNGRWVKRGESMADGTSLLIGHRKEYYDYSF
jgi:hypothetical protein